MLWLDLGANSEIGGIFFLSLSPASGRGVSLRTSRTVREVWGQGLEGLQSLQREYLPTAGKPSLPLELA